MVYNKINRLLKIGTAHDTDTRTCAIIYIDGNFYENDVHNECLNDYLNDKNLNRQYDTEGYSRRYLSEEITKNEHLSQLPFACLHKINKSDFNQLFTNYVDYEYGDMNDYLNEYPGNYIEENAIFVDMDSIRNISLNELISYINIQYPNYTIYEEDYNEPFNFEEFKKIGKGECSMIYKRKSRLKKISQFYNYKQVGKKAILIYVNPTGREVDELIDESPYSDVRGFLHSDGTTYAWDGQFLHSDVKKHFPEINSPVHFDITSSMITLYITPQIKNAQELSAYLKTFNLSNYGINGNTELFIDYDYYRAPENVIYDYNNENYLGIDSFIKLSDNPDVLNGYDPFMDEDEKKQYENIV